MDRADSFSSQGGPVYPEVMAALYPLDEKPLAINYIYGIGGRDVRVESIEEVFNELEKIKNSNDAGDKYRYLGLRGEDI